MKKLIIVLLVLGLAGTGSDAWGRGRRAARKKANQKMSGPAKTAVDSALIPSLVTPHLAGNQTDGNWPRSWRDYDDGGSFTGKLTTMKKNGEIRVRSERKGRWHTARVVEDSRIMLGKLPGSPKDMAIGQKVRVIWGRSRGHGRRKGHSSREVVLLKIIPEETTGIIESINLEGESPRLVLADKSGKKRVSLKIHPNAKLWARNKATDLPAVGNELTVKTIKTRKGYVLIGLSESDLRRFSRKKPASKPPARRK